MSESISSQPSSAPVSSGLTHLLRLVSNKPPQGVTGLDDFLASFNTGDFQAVIAPFRHIIQRKSRRTMGGKFGKGLTHEVTDNVEVSPNEDLVALRRWLGVIRPDPQAIMLLQTGKVKEDSLAAPLIFSELFRAKKPILITGLDALSRDQLLCPIDISCKTMPAEVKNNPALKASLVSRPQRKKGFMSSMRNLMELNFIDSEIRDKIVNIATGADSELTQNEIVNLSLLADLVSRYQVALSNYKEAIRTNSLQVPQLRHLFDVVTADIPVPATVQAFQNFINTEKVELSQITSKETLFAHAYSYIAGEDAGKDKVDRKDLFHKTLFSLVIRWRVNVDAKLWGRCLFLEAREPDEEPVLAGIRPFVESLEPYVGNDEGGSADALAEDAIRNAVGRQIYTLIKLANQDPSRMREPAELARQKLGNRLLPLFRLKGFNTLPFIFTGKPNPDVPAAMGDFLKAFSKVSVTQGDLSRLEKSLRSVLFNHQFITLDIREKMFHVISHHAREKVQDLSKIYLRHLPEQIPHFFFALDPRSLSPLEMRLSATAMETLLGLEVGTPAPNQDAVLLFHGGRPKGGKLRHTPEQIGRAYRDLLGGRVSRAADDLVENKLNYQMAKYGSTFGEALHFFIAKRHGLGVSRMQLVALMKEKGPLKNLTLQNMDPVRLLEMADPFIPLRKSELGKNPPEDYSPVVGYHDFGPQFQQSSSNFLQLLGDYQSSHNQDPSPGNPSSLIWRMIAKGIFNPLSDRGRAFFQESGHQRALAGVVADICTRNAEAILGENPQDGVEIRLPMAWHHLIMVADRIPLLTGSQAIQIRLVPDFYLGEKEKEPSESTRVFLTELEQIMASPEAPPELSSLRGLGLEMERFLEQWRGYSRLLAVWLLDEILTRIEARATEPFWAQSKNLFFLPDEVKLCLGRPVKGLEAAPFGRILKRPDNLGSLSRNPRVASTTVDEMTVESYKITKLEEDLQKLRRLCLDVADSVMLLSLSADEAELFSQLSQLLGHMATILGKPLKQFRDDDLQMLHQLAEGLKMTIQSMMDLPGAAKSKAIYRLLDRVQSLRSDGSTFRFNLFESFILPPHLVKNKKGGPPPQAAMVSAEGDGQGQSYPQRISEFLTLKAVLDQKHFIVVAPDGHRRSQVDHALHIVNTFIKIRGLDIQLYLDRSSISEEGLADMATRINPVNIFHHDQLSLEPLPGMKYSGEMDPMTGRPKAPDMTLETFSVLRKKSLPVIPQPPPKAPKPQTLPQAPAQGPKLQAIPAPGGGGEEGAKPALLRDKTGQTAFIYSPAGKRFLFPMGNQRIPAMPLPIPGMNPGTSLVLATKLPNGRILFHGLHQREIILPLEKAETPPLLARFQLGETLVQVVNEGGKPVVKAGKAQPLAGAQP
ncbi:MAG: hypothetical protein OEV94_02550 [Deltaproteobacteria bacterium]|nr:hypothetical protein [Deltaproteobacteria bacterium]